MASNLFVSIDDCESGSEEKIFVKSLVLTKLEFLEAIYCAQMAMRGKQPLKARVKRTCDDLQCKTVGCLRHTCYDFKLVLYADYNVEESYRQFINREYEQFCGRFSIGTILSDTPMATTSGQQTTTVREMVDWKNVVMKWHLIYNNRKELKGKQLAATDAKFGESYLNINVTPENTIYSVKDKSYNFYKIALRFKLFESYVRIMHEYHRDPNPLNKMVAKAKASAVEIKSKGVDFAFNRMGFVRDDEIVPFIPEVIVAEIVSTLHLDYTSIWIGYSEMRIHGFMHKFDMKSFAEEVCRWFKKEGAYQKFDITVYDMVGEETPLVCAIIYKKGRNTKGILIHNRAFHVLRVMDLAFIRVMLDRKDLMANSWQVASTKRKMSVDIGRNGEVKYNETRQLHVSNYERIRYSNMAVFVSRAMNAVENINMKRNEGNDLAKLEDYNDIDLSRMEEVFNYVIGFVDNDRQRRSVFKDLIADAMTAFLKHSSALKEMNFVVMLIITGLVVRNEVLRYLRSKHIEFTKLVQYKCLQDVLNYFASLGEKKFDPSLLNTARNHWYDWIDELLIEMSDDHDYDEMFSISKKDLGDNVFHRNFTVNCNDVSAINMLYETGVFTKNKFGVNIERADLDWDDLMAGFTPTVPIDGKMRKTSAVEALLRTDMETEGQCSQASDLDPAQSQEVLLTEKDWIEMIQ